MKAKKVIVTGGTLGIGAVLVETLIADGADVAFMARGKDSGELAAKRYNAAGPGRAWFHVCDVSNRVQVHHAFAAAVADMGGLDALVHVAAVHMNAAPETESGPQWDSMIGINATGTFNTNQEAFPYLRKAGQGTIVNFGSGAGIIGMPVAGAYAASKGAVLGWSRSIAAAWGPLGITVNVVCPSVSTPMYQHFRDQCSDEELRLHDEWAERTILMGGKLGDPKNDLVPMVLFLLSNGARFITGQTLNVDGGMIFSR